jgi:hypothetical protein
MNPHTSWLNKARAGQPLSDMEDQVGRILGDPRFLASIAWERETGTSDIHPYRKAMGFRARSNPDGANPYTKGTDGVPAVFAGQVALMAGLGPFKNTAKQIRHLRWSPSPFKMTRIAKKDVAGRVYGWREIGVPTWKDRVILEGLRQILERLIDPFLPTNQHGYRATKVDGVRIDDLDLMGNPRGARETVVKAILKGRASGYHFIQEGDIVNAFPSVSRNKLRTKLTDLGASHRAANFLLRCSGVNCTAYGQKDKVQGIAMGSAISPALWNIYSMGFLNHHHGDTLVHAYADNFWVQSRTRTTHGAGTRTLNSVAKGLGLALQWGGNRPTDLRIDPTRVMGLASSPIGAKVGIEPEGNVGGKDGVLPRSEDTTSAVSSTAPRVPDGKGVAYPSNPRTDSSTGTSGGCLTDPCYRAAVGNPDEGAAPWTITVKGAASAVLPDTTQSSRHGIPEITLPPWGDVVSGMPNGLKPESVIRRWWNTLSARLPCDSNRQLLVRIPLNNADSYLAIAGCFGEPIELSKTITDPKEVGDDHWVRQTDFVDGDMVTVLLRRKRRKPPKWPKTAQRRGWHIVLRSEGVKDGGQTHHHAGAIAIYLPGGMQPSGADHLCQSVRTLPFHTAKKTSSLAAQATVLTSILNVLPAGSEVTIWTNQMPILNALKLKAQAPRPAEMHQAVLAVRRATRTRNHQVKMQKAFPDGQLGRRLILRWASARTALPFIRGPGL